MRSTTAPPWLWVDALPVAAGMEVAVVGDEAAHLAGPLRRRPGEAVVLFDGAGTTAAGPIVEVGQRRARVAVTAVEVTPPSVGDGVTVALALLHTQAMDWAVEKAVEVGARRFVPVVAERSQLGRRQVEGRTGRWRRTVVQASKQCRRPWLMEVAEPVELTELVARWNGAGLVASAAGRRAETVPAAVPGRLLVGPEGGFSPAEEALLTTCSFLPLWLGPHILRAETAAVVGAAVLVARDLLTRETQS